MEKRDLEQLLLLIASLNVDDINLDPRILLDPKSMQGKELRLQTSHIMQKARQFQYLPFELSETFTLFEQGFLNLTEKRNNSLIALHFLAEAKSLALQIMLKNRMAEVLKIRDVVNYNWQVSFIPSFQVPAILILINDVQSTRGAFGVGKFVKETNLPITFFEFKLTWTDPVTTILKDFDLFAQDEKGLTLDGIAYRLSCETSYSKLNINFSNPQTNPFTKLEQAFHKVAWDIVNNTDSNQKIEKDYLSTFHFD